METKYVQTIDELGRVILPKAFREKHGWGEGRVIAMQEADGALLLSLDASSEDNNE